MSTYEFYPFVDPSNNDKIVFPDFSTIMERQEVSLPVEEKRGEETKEEEIGFDVNSKSKETIIDSILLLE